MPTILLRGGCRFFFYSLEGREPAHIHVEQAGKTAKFWLESARLAASDGFRAHELNRLRLLIIENRVIFQESWDEHFGRKGQP